MAKILVPMDFSKEAYLALDWALKLAGADHGSALYLVHVRPVVPDMERDHEILQDLKRRMTDLRSTFLNDIPFIVVYREGRICDQIADICRQELIDMVIMTTRGRLGAARELEGSVTEETVRVAPCPVLVLHLNQSTVDKVRQRFDSFIPHEDDGVAL